MDIESAAKRLLGLIEKAGIREGEVYLETSSGLDMQARDQAVERLKRRETGGFGLRLVADKKMSMLYSSDLTDASMEKAVARGVDLAKVAAPDDANTFGEPVEGTTDVGVFDQSFDEIPLDRKLGLLRDIETLAFACDPAVKRIEYLAYSDSKSDVLIANTKGLMKRKQDTAFTVGCSVIAESNGEVETGGDDMESRFFDSIDPPSKIASRACWKATSLLGSKSVPSQSVPVIFDRDAGSALLAYLSSMISGENIATGVSILRERIGDAIASPLVTVVDNAVMQGGIASAPFDGEGTPCRETTVLDRGSLMSFLFDRRTALKSGAESTGNGVRGGFRSPLSVGTTNFYMAAGGPSADDIIKSTPRGLWVVNLTGWWMGVSPATGDFSSGARGFWIENGEAQFPVKNVTVASNLLDMLDRIDVVGSDLFFRHSTATPTFRVAGMSVGGI